jgi:hypothetical protein
MTSSFISNSLIPLPPIVQAKSSVITQKKEIVFGTSKPRNVALFDKTAGLAASRFSQLGLDLSFALLGGKDGATSSSTTLGRIWTPVFPAKVRFGTCSPFTHNQLAPGTAYAGFRHGLADTASMHALAAISTTLGTTTDRSYITDDARTALNRIFSTNFQPIRMLTRLAILWTAAAITEEMGTSLRCHTADDAITARPVRNLNEWGQALVAANAGLEQPVLVNLRGSEGAGRFARIVRMACLPNPVLTTGLNQEPPTITRFWPPITNARAYIMAEFDATTPLAGTVTARDIAIVMSYYSRAWNCENELNEALDLVTSLALRPSGSAAMGSSANIIISLPTSNTSQAVLLPITQAIDSLDDEEIVERLELPAPLLLSGACSAAVFLTAHSNTLATIGVSAASLLGPECHSEISTKYAQLTLKRDRGASATCAALILAADMGWVGAYSHLTLGITTFGGLSGNLHYPIESEECIPFIDSLPDTSATLGTLRPSALDAPVVFNTPVAVTAVHNRLNTSDAFYSLLAAQANPTFVWMAASQGWINTQKRYVPKQSYRGTPTDGQFVPFSWATSRANPAFSLHTGADVLRAMGAVKARSGWEWYYEWLTAFEDTDVLSAFIDAPPIPTDFVAPVMPSEPMTHVQPPPITHKLKLPEPRDFDELVDDWKENLGDAFSDAHDAYQVMKALVGKEVSEMRYEQKVRALSDAVVALDAETLKCMIPEEEHGPFFSYFSNMAVDAGHWDRTPSFKANLAAVGAAYQSIANQAATQYEECTPPHSERAHTPQSEHSGGRQSQSPTPSIHAPLTGPDIVEAQQALDTTPLQADFGRTGTGHAREAEPTQSMLEGLQNVPTATFTAGPHGS